MRRTRAQAVARSIAAAGVALCLLVTPAVAEGPWALRFGAARSQLYGDLARVYPNADVAGTLGLSVRTPQGPWRLRTGFQLEERAGEGKVDILGIVIDSTGFGYGPTGVRLSEHWSTPWLEIPVQLERGFGRDQRLGYVGLGVVAARRFTTKNEHHWDVPPEVARRFDVGLDVCIGRELLRQGGVSRIELGFTRGLRPVAGDGSWTGGTWQAWRLLVDVTP